MFDTRRQLPNYGACNAGTEPSPQIPTTTLKELYLEKIKNNKTLNPKNYMTVQKDLFLKAIDQGATLDELLKNIEYAGKTLNNDFFVLDKLMSELKDSKSTPSNSAKIKEICDNWEKTKAEKPSSPVKATMFTSSPVVPADLLNLKEVFVKLNIT